MSKINPKPNHPALIEEEEKTRLKENVFSSLIKR
jgi:hypothetical protein